MEVLHQHCVDIRRNPDDIGISVKVKVDEDPGAIADIAWQFREAGADHIIAMFEAPFDPAKLGDVAERIGPVMT